MTTLTRRVGDSIRAHREALGWSQRDLAERAQTGQSAVSRYEAGERTMGIDILVRISNALNVAPGVFLCGLMPGESNGRVIALCSKEAA